MKEDEIRNRNAFNQYLDLVAKDIDAYLDASQFITIGCPVCGGERMTHEFRKHGFDYVTCLSCATLFANPRPPYEAMRRFYAESPSTSFWINQFFMPVAETRREKIFKPRARYIAAMLNGKGRLTIGDVGSGFGIFLEELRRLAPGNRYVAIEPSNEMANLCRAKDLEVSCSCLEDVQDMKGEFDLLTGFELLEHLVDPRLFLRRASQLLKPGGLLYLTTLNGKGFDIVVLWDRSKSVAPPHHLNFFNPQSARMLLEQLGFEAVEISTPGELDWDIVEGMIMNEGADVGRLWNLVARERDSGCKEELQAWIQKNRLSSHMRIVARKS
jgi:SAM-dependent methyltransferase